MDVRTACLGVLSRGDATGYEIKKYFEEGPFGHFFDAGFGSIYPALARLCQEGLATVQVIEEAGRPVRKSYSITAHGRESFEKAILETPAEDRFKSEWIFIAYFAELLPPELLARRVEERLGWYRARLTIMRACDEEQLREGERFVLHLGMAVYEAALRFIQENGTALVEATRHIGRSADAGEQGRRRR